MIPNRDLDYESRRNQKKNKEIVEYEKEPKCKKESSGFEEAYKSLLSQGNQVTCL